MHEYYAKKAPKLKKAMNDKEERSPMKPSSSEEGDM